MQARVLSCGQGLKIDKVFFDDKEVKVKNKRGGSLGSIGSTLGHLEVVEPKKGKKDALNGLKSNNWIGTEDDFQIAVAKLLDAYGLKWFHCPNGGSRNAREGAKFKRMGVKAGVPDIIIINTTIEGDVGMAIELKVGKNTRSKPQTDWLLEFFTNGWVVATCYSIPSVEKLLERYYGI